jgi:hypothetical protein
VHSSSLTDFRESILFVAHAPEVVRVGGDRATSERIEALKDMLVYQPIGIEGWNAASNPFFESNQPTLKTNRWVSLPLLGDQFRFKCRKMVNYYAIRSRVTSVSCAIKPC